MASTITDVHRERPTGHSELLRNGIIGFSDGVTVPFALTAGLSSLGSTKIVILGGLAELFAGAISMGLGAFMASLTERKHYEVEEAKARQDLKDMPAQQQQDKVCNILDQYGLSKSTMQATVGDLKQDEDLWIKVCTAIGFEGMRPKWRPPWLTVPYTVHDGL